MCNGGLSLIILASASPRRRELLQQIGCKFRIIPSSAEENNTALVPPEQLVMQNALLKAADVALQAEINDLVIGADTVVVFQNKVFGKPVDVKDAKRMLSSLAGHTHTVYTGVALIKGNAHLCDFEKTDVRISNLTSTEIEKYVATGEPMDKAGAYAIQGISAVFIEEIQGCYTNVVGLPLNKLMNLCKKVGISLL